MHAASAAAAAVQQPGQLLTACHAGCALHWCAHGGNVCLQLSNGFLQALHLTLQRHVLSLQETAAAAAAVLPRVSNTGT